MTPTAGFVGRQDELAVLSERFSEAARGRPQVVYLEGEAGSGKSTLLSRFLGSLSDAVILEAGGDEDEPLLSYGVVDQLDPHATTDRGTTRWLSAPVCWISSTALEYHLRNSYIKLDITPRRVLAALPT